VAAIKRIELTLAKRWKGCASSAVPETDKIAYNMAICCAACSLPDGGLDIGALSERMFMIMLRNFLNPDTFNQKTLMKYYKEILLPDNRKIPFCAYNNVGYREEARARLAQPSRDRRQTEASGTPYEPAPLSFHFGQEATVNNAGIMWLLNWEFNF
jgi:hypothetical protein